MALVLPRLTIFFEQDDYSWSESYYYRKVVNTLGAMVKPADILARARLALLGRRATARGSPRLVGYRLSDDTVRRDSLVNTGLAGVVNDWGPDVPDEVAQPYDAFVIRCETIDGYHKQFYLSGLPLKVFSDVTGVPNVVPQFNARYGDFASILMSDWAWKAAADQFSAIPAGWVEIDEMSSVGEIVSLTTTLTPPIGDLVSIRSGQFPARTPRISGIFTVVPGPAGLLSIRVPGLVQPVNYLGGGFVKIYLAVLRNIDAVKFIKHTHRKRGALVGFVRHGRFSKRT